MKIEEWEMKSIRNHYQYFLMFSSIDIIKCLSLNRWDELVGSLVGKFYCAGFLVLVRSSAVCDLFGRAFVGRPGG
jgi:hypothetical protein